MVKYLLVAHDEEGILAECSSQKELNAEIDRNLHDYNVEDFTVYEIKTSFIVKKADEPFYLEAVSE